MLEESDSIPSNLDRPCWYLSRAWRLRVGIESDVVLDMSYHQDEMIA